MTLNSNFTGLDDTLKDRKTREARFKYARRRAVLFAVGSMAAVLLAMGAGAVVGELLPAGSAHVAPRFIGAFTAGGLMGFITMSAYVLKWAAYADENKLGTRIWLSAAAGAFLAGPWGAAEGLPRVDSDGPEVYFGSLIAGVVAVVVIGLLKTFRFSNRRSVELGKWDT